MMQTKLFVLLALVLASQAFKFTSTRSRGLQVPRLARLSMSDGEAGKDPNQDVQDLNLEEMFDVFEAAEQADSPAKAKDSSDSPATTASKGFPDFSDPQDWITIGLVLLIIKNTADIISEWLAK
jgi:hypothetical protein